MSRGALQVLQTLKRPSGLEAPLPADGLAMPRVACVQPPLLRAPLEQPVLIERQLLALDATAPHFTKLDEGIAKWQEWCQDQQETEPATYMVQETRTVEELQEEQIVSERILKYGARARRPEHAPCLPESAWVLSMCMC